MAGLTLSATDATSGTGSCTYFRSGTTYVSASGNYAAARRTSAAPRNPVRIVLSLILTDDVLTIDSVLVLIATLSLPMARCSIRCLAAGHHLLLLELHRSLRTKLLVWRFVAHPRLAPAHRTSTVVAPNHGMEPQPTTSEDASSELLLPLAGILLQRTPTLP